MLSFTTQDDVLAFLRSPGNHDSDEPGLIELGKFSDSTCSIAPAASNHETLTLVFNTNASDSIVVAGGSYFLTEFGNGGGELFPVRVQRGDSTTYTFTASGPAELLGMFIGAQLQFAPRGATFEDDINFAATFIRRISFEFDYEQP